MRACPEFRIDTDFIAAGNARRRMHENSVASSRAFRIERLLHYQRPIMPSCCQHGAPIAARNVSMTLQHLGS